MIWLLFQAQLLMRPLRWRGRVWPGVVVWCSELAEDGDGEEVYRWHCPEGFQQQILGKPQPNHKPLSYTGKQALGKCDTHCTAPVQALVHLAQHLPVPLGRWEHLHIYVSSLSKALTKQLQLLLPGIIPGNYWHKIKYTHWCHKEVDKSRKEMANSNC